jgi:hypothetical protein
MRISALLALIGLGVARTLLAGTTPAPTMPPDAAAQPSWPQKTVWLDEADALARLQVANPRHYQIARQILASAERICKASKPELLAMKFAARDIACSQALWLTSNPPKHALHFQIEDTTYSVLVTVRNLAPKATPAR